MAGLVGLLIGGAAIAAVTGVGGISTPAPADPERAKIEAVVRDYILAHPEIIPEAMGRLRDRETAKQVESSRPHIEKPFAGAWAGAEDGDVVLVEFFDYACGYCRQSVPDIDRLLAEDKKLKVVFRELPILSAESEAAAKVSLVAAKQGDFMAFHRAMYAAGRPSDATIATARSASGLDAAAVASGQGAADIRAELDANLAAAQSLGLTGTPSFVVGDRVLSGAVGYDALKKTIAETRAKKKG